MPLALPVITAALFSSNNLGTSDFQVFLILTTKHTKDTKKPATKYHAFRFVLKALATGSNPPRTRSTPITNSPSGLRLSKFPVCTATLQQDVQPQGGSVAAGKAGMLANGQCILHPESAMVTGTGTGATLSLKVKFTNRFANKE